MPRQARRTPPVADPPPSGPSLGGTAATLLLVALVAAAYGNSLRGAFVYDDVHEITDNPAIRTLLPPWEAMFVGNILPARPLPYLTFALNFAVGGLDPAGFHAVNVMIHAIAAVALYQLVRLGLESPRLTERFGTRAVPLALACAAIWGVHPLTTQAVTYVYQRIESLTAMFMLLALAAFASAAARGFPRGRLAACVACSCAAMASKETAVVLPVLVLLYDWCLVAGPAADLRRRRGFYAGLASTWLVLAAQLASQGEAYQEVRSLPHSPLAYALTQAEVVLHYLKLAAWPAGQCFDYGWPIATDWRLIVPSLAVVLAAVAATAWAVIRRRPWAVPAAAFFLALSPTSSIMPVDAVAAEHRMYLPLAAVISLAVPAAAAGWSHLAGRGSVAPGRLHTGFALTCTVLVVALAMATHRRNELYSRPTGVWLEALARNPANPRPSWMLAGYCDLADETDAAIAFADRTVAVDPGSGVYRELVRTRIGKGDLTVAERFARRAVELHMLATGPEGKETLLAVSDLVTVLQNRGDPAAESLAGEWLPRFERVLGADDVATLQATTIVSARATRVGDPATGERLAAAVLEALDHHAEYPGRFRRAAIEALAAAVAAQGRVAEAEKLLREAIVELGRLTGRRTTDVSMLRLALATQLATSGREAEAIAELEAACDWLKRTAGPDHPATRLAERKREQLQRRTIVDGASP